MISLVVPTYNERQNIGELVRRTGKTLGGVGDEFELIIVDDSSPDGTSQEVRRLQESRSWLRLVGSDGSWRKWVKTPVCRSRRSSPDSSVPTHR